jgi:lysophospholipase L1-like esterase
MAGLAGYAKWKDVTLGTAALISADVSNCYFAITFTSTETNFWANQDGAGEYVRWTLTDNTLLKFHVERYDTVNKVAVWHVKVPTAYAASDTVIQCQYSNATPTDGSDRPGTFDANTALAMHLSTNQTGGAFVDATSNGNNGTNTGTTDTAGQIDRGRNFSGTSQYITVPDSASLDVSTALTIEGWFRVTGGAGSTRRICYKGHYTSSSDTDIAFTAALMYTDKLRLYLSQDGGTSNAAYVDSTTTYTDTNWHHVAFKFGGGSSLKIIVDGVDVTGSVVGSITSINNSADPLWIGTDKGVTQEWFGDLDEFVVHNVDRSLDYLKLRYHSGKGDIVTIGAEQTVPGALSGTIVAVSSLTGTLNGGTAFLSGSMAAGSTLTGTLAGGTDVSDKTTWNPADKDANITLSSGDLVATSNLDGWQSVRAKDGKSANKWYWEVKSLTQAAGTNNVIGIGKSTASLASYPGGDTNGWGYSSVGAVYTNGSPVVTGLPTWAQGDIIGVALDLDNGKLWFSKNGTWVQSGDPANGLNPQISGIAGTLYPMVSPYKNGNQLEANFGQTALTYTPPSGFITGPDVWLQRAVCIGDSIAFGQGSTAIDLETRLETLQSLNTGDVLNKGIQGEQTDELDVRFQADALDIKAGTVYIVSGTNNNYITPTRTVAQTISDYTSMINKAKAMSPVPTVVLGEVTPANKSGGADNLTKEQIQEWIKLLDAEIRKLCLEQGIKMAPSYQEMCDTSTAADDDLRPAYANDTVHPNDTGYSRLGDLFNIGAVPSRLYRWGQAVIAINDEGWGWWVKNGTASVAGDPDIGTLTLPQNQNADSDVKCLEQYQKTITISPTVTAGSVTIKYRTNTGNFDRVSGAIAWQTYTVPFTTSDQFIQIRLEGASATDATVSDVSLTWTAGSQFVGLSGTTAGVSTLTGTAGVTIPITGALSGISAQSGTATVTRLIPVAGALTGLSVYTGTAGVLRPLQGLQGGLSTFTGALAVRRAGTITVQVYGLSSLAGGLSADYGLGGTSVSSMVLSGGLYGTLSFSGSLSAALSATGALGLIGQPSGTSSGGGSHFVHDSSSSVPSSVVQRSGRTATVTQNNNKTRVTR